MTREELKQKLNTEPLPEEIKKNDDGSLYIPIGTIQNKLDELFDTWNWVFDDRVIETKKTLSGSGKLHVGVAIKEDVPKLMVLGSSYFQTDRSGTATIEASLLEKNALAILDAYVFLNAAKKLGKWFGRDLNRQLEDAPLKTIQLKGDITNEENDEKIKEDFNKVVQKLKEAKTKKEAEEILQSGAWKLNNECKLIVASKPE